MKLKAVRFSVSAVCRAWSRHIKLHRHINATHSIWRARVRLNFLGCKKSNAAAVLRRSVLDTRPGWVRNESQMPGLTNNLRWPGLIHQPPELSLNYYSWQNIGPCYIMSFHLGYLWLFSRSLFLKNEVQGAGIRVVGNVWEIPRTHEVQLKFLQAGPVCFGPLWNCWST